MWGLAGSFARSLRCEPSGWVGRRFVINCFMYLCTVLWPLPSHLGYWSVLYLGIAHEEQQLAWRRATAPGLTVLQQSRRLWSHWQWCSLTTWFRAVLSTRGQICIWIANLALSSFASLIAMMLMSFSHTRIFRECLVKSMCGASHNFPVCVELRGRHIWSGWLMVRKNGF